MAAPLFLGAASTFLATGFRAFPLMGGETAHEGQPLLVDISRRSARNGRQLLLQAFNLLEEPDVLTAIAFLDESLQGSALKSVFRNDADDGELDAVVHEFLRDCTGKTGTQLEEVRGEPDGWKDDQLGVPSNRFAEDVRGFAFGLEDGAVCGDFENLYAVKSVGGGGHGSV